MRKPFLFVSLSVVLLLTLTAVLAYPWRGISLITEWEEIRGGRIVYSFPHSGKVIALTFDDGPDVRYTPRILDILKRNGIHATFFLCGRRVSQFPELARRIVAEGHALGNHTETHPHLEYEGLADVRCEIDGCEQQISSITGQKPLLFRPPRGLLSRSILSTVVSRGYKIVEWSLAFDRAKEKRSAVLTARVLRLARAGDILLMHDGSASKADERGQSVRELDNLIHGLRVRGFRFATVTDLLPANPVHGQPRTLGRVARGTKSP